MKVEPQIRRPKVEGRKKSEGRNATQVGFAGAEYAHFGEELRYVLSGFGFRPSFGFGPSDLGFGSSFAIQRQQRGATAGFTLVEVLLALAICAIVLVAINAVFATAVRLRDRTSSRVSDAVPIERTLEMLRRDLKGAVGPRGYLAGDFKCSVQTMGSSMGISGQAAGGSGLDFFTATGVLRDEAPWGDVEEVFYELKAPAERNQAGMDLVRYANRNLLSTTLVTPEAQTLLSHVATLDCDCYDGMTWRSYWDTSSGDTNLPAAVRVRIQLAAGEGETGSRPQPLELTVPLMMSTRTNLTQ